MITFNGQTYALDDPLSLAILGGAALILLLFVLIITTLRAASRSARMTEPMLFQMQNLGSRVQSLSDGQQQLSGGLTHVSQAQATSQAKMLQLMEQRLADVTRNMTESLQGTATRTARGLGELQQRLETIDKAQENITNQILLVVAFPIRLSNKHSRVAFR